MKYIYGTFNSAFQIFVLSRVVSHYRTLIQPELWTDNVSNNHHHTYIYDFHFIFRFKLLLGLVFHYVLQMQTTMGMLQSFPPLIRVVLFKINKKRRFPSFRTPFTSYPPLLKVLDMLIRVNTVPKSFHVFLKQRGILLKRDTFFLIFCLFFSS